MLVLGIDCAVDQLSVALHDGEKLRAHTSVAGARGHVEKMTGMIEALLAETGATADHLTQIAVGVGPGSFTGIRIALATARGLALGLGIDVVGVTTTQALVYSLHISCPVLAAIDAHKGQIYGQWFLSHESPLSEIFVALPENIPFPDGVENGVVIGSGTVLVLERHSACITPHTDPEPNLAAAIAAIVAKPDKRPLLPPLPVYLRAPDAKTEAERG